MISWELIDDAPSIWRAKILGGWLVMLRAVSGESITFVPDPGHRWDGRSI